MERFIHEITLSKGKRGSSELLFYFASESAGKLSSTTSVILSHLIAFEFIKDPNTWCNKFLKERLDVHFQSSARQVELELGDGLRVENA